MSTATRILRNRIVLIFDFDDTLGPSTTSTLFEALELDYEPFHKKVNERMEENWQYPLAKAEAFREWSHREDCPLNRDRMLEVAKNYALFPGANDFIGRLRQYAGGKDSDIELEFVLLTAGFGTIPENTPIAKDFDRIYAGELLFAEDGKILGAKRVISHVDKVHYIEQLQQGLDLDGTDELENTYLNHDRNDDYVPMRQVIYVGDGASDMSAFQAVEGGGGIAIAIDPDKGKDWLGYEEMAPARRVHNVAQGNYEESSELFRSLKLAIDRSVAEIQLLRMGEGE